MILEKKYHRFRLFVKEFQMSVLFSFRPLLSISRLRFLDNHAFFFYVGCVLGSVIQGYIVSSHGRQKLAVHKIKENG